MPITFSAGLAGLNGLDGDSRPAGQTALKSANALMYAAKSAGRDRVECQQSPTHDGGPIGSAGYEYVEIVVGPEGRGEPTRPLPRSGARWPAPASDRPGGRWGLALGADRWAADFAVGADIMMSAPDKPAPAPRGPAGAEDAIAEVRVLRRDHETLVEQATQAAFVLWPRLRNSDAAMRATREDLSSTLHVVAAATLVEDQDLVTDYIRWFETVFTTRSLPLAFVSNAFGLLLGVLPAEVPRARDMALFGRDACTEATLDAAYGLENP